MTARKLGDTLLFATHNAGKLEEMRALLAPHGVTIVSAAELGLPEPEETEDSFVGNARIKAHSAAKATGLVALSDDSGLCVDALEGAPGVFTADWAEGPGGRDFGKAMSRTHDALLARGAGRPWAASFVCVLVLAWPDGGELVFEGAIAGHLTWPIRGEEGHGYDPMFVPVGHDVTFAEMPKALKNSMSHRSKALSALLAECFT